MNVAPATTSNADVVKSKGRKAWIRRTTSTPAAMNQLPTNPAPITHASMAHQSYSGSHRKLSTRVLMSRDHRGNGSGCHPSRATARGRARRSAHVAYYTD